MTGAQYAIASRKLDDELLRRITRWHDDGLPFETGAFDDLARRLLSYQLRYNRPYADYCKRFGVTVDSLPDSWESIPAVPAAAFKEAALTTFDPARAVLAFATSGTTAGSSGRHYFESAEMYDAALLAGFDRFVLPDAAKLQYFNLVPNPAGRPTSSLGYMMARVARERGVAPTGWYVDGDRLDDAGFERDLSDAVAAGRPVCIAATAFALLAAVEALERRRLRMLLPRGSRVMETGGFKGRTHAIARDELYRRAGDRFGLSDDAIVAEYGMTELTSQYYDDGLLCPKNASHAVRRKVAPPWLRTRVAGPDGRTLAAGTVGALVHVDLANRASCIAIATEDLGVWFDATPERAAGLVLIGRDHGAELRGCSLDAETLLPARAVTSDSAWE